MLIEYLPEDVMEVLKLWDNKETLWSLELGGGSLGPNYEMTIQFSAWEIIRELKGKAPEGSEEQIKKQLSRALNKIDDKFSIGHSGATAGAAQWLAYKFMKEGYKTSVSKFPKDRLIMISKNFPGSGK